MNDDALFERARAWMADDPDPDTRGELQALLDADDTASIAERFTAPLSFGTAGLRGLLGAGPQRMNRSVVARTTAALCAHLRTLAPPSATLALCVGFDGRRKSHAFATEVIEVAAGAGFVVHAFREVTATPLLSFSVPCLGATAGVMITASHNPPAYNGYKVYAATGVQLIPPHDAAISARSAAIDSVLAIPRRAREDAERAGTVRYIDEYVTGQYERGLRAQLSALSSPTARSSIKIAYTALHGVGERPARRMLHAAGFDDVVSVATQSAPDGTFPTVSFPNPEESSAMAEVLALADASAADVAMANDPDADRLAVAARDRTGRLYEFNGNDLGVLLTDYVLRHTDEPARACVITSIVTTTLVQAIAKHYGAHWEATLTGTKWICSRALELERARGLRCAIGFEEAIGYCIGTLVREKDGLSAAVYVARMAADAKTRGRTLVDELERVHRAHGLSMTRQVSLTLTGEHSLARVNQQLRSFATRPPHQLGPIALEGVIDLSRGETLPPTTGVILGLRGGHRVCIRPSGTEPKLKCYLEARDTVGSDETYEAARRRAATTLDALARSLTQLLA